MKVVYKVKSMSLLVVMTSILTITGSTLFINPTYADDAKYAYDQAKLGTELEFSETIQKAKAELKAISEDSPIDPETKKQDKENYDKIIAEAKITRDKKIQQAREEFTKSINTTKIEYEKQLEDTRQSYTKELSEITVSEDIKSLKKQYAEILDAIKQAYNNAIASAHAEYQKIKDYLKGGEKDA